jgi:hypothetical protein
MAFSCTERARAFPAGRWPHLGLGVDDFLQALQEPRVDLAGLVHLVDREAEAQRLRHLQQPVRRRRADGLADGIVVLALAQPSISISSRPVSPVSRLRSAFCSDSWKVRPMAIASPTDFIEVVSTGSARGTSRRQSAESW